MGRCVLSKAEAEDTLTVRCTYLILPTPPNVCMCVCVAV